MSEGSVLPPISGAACEGSDVSVVRTNVVTHPPAPAPPGLRGTAPQVTLRSVEELREQLRENAPELRRILRKLDMQRSGEVSVETMARAIVTALTLNPARDTAVVHRACEEAANSEGKVTLAAMLQKTTAAPVDVTRYRAPGIMDPSMQKLTTGTTPTPLGYTYRGPPFAVLSDADQMTSIIQEFHSHRLAAQRQKLEAYSKDGVWLTHAQFIQAVKTMDRYQVPDYEAEALIDSLDPGRKRGRINIEAFLSAFGNEYMKNKSSRATIGGNVNVASNTLQWPSSLDDSYDRKGLIQQLRTRRAPKLKLGARAKRIQPSGGSGLMHQPVPPPGARSAAPRRTAAKETKA